MAHLRCGVTPKLKCESGRPRRRRGRAGERAGAGPGRLGGGQDGGVPEVPEGAEDVLAEGGGWAASQHQLQLQELLQVVELDGGGHPEGGDGF